MHKNESNNPIPQQSNHPIQNILPENGLLRLSQIVGDKKKGITPIIPVSKSSWWAGVASGRYTYGGDGFLLKQVVDGVETRFARRGYSILQERNSVNTITRSLLWNPIHS